jgi:uncharacterized protein (TIGR01777 family)
MRILISGSSGLVGTALSNALRADGHAVARLVRPGKQAAAGDVRWNPDSGEIDLAAMEGAEAVVNLAGASIGEDRWNEGRKQILRSSRVDATRHLVESLTKLQRPPRTIVSASAIGYYGDRSEEVLTETSPPGNDFLAQLGRDWEAAALGAERFGIRAVTLRFGVILAAHGGALPRMLPPFKMGLGGRLGSGKQWMSWLTLEEAVRLVRFATENPDLRGPVNAVAPNPVRNAEFTRMLGLVLRRPAVFPVPPFVLRVALGEMANSLLLASQRVVPEKLAGLGYSFKHPNLETALRAVLHRNG